MFSLFGKVSAKYEKLFFDLDIKSINGEVINFDQYKGKTILVVNVADRSGVGLLYCLHSLLLNPPLLCPINQG